MFKIVKLTWANLFLIFWNNVTRDSCIQNHGNDSCFYRDVI